MRIPPHAKYEIIYEMTKQNGNRLSVSTLCEIAGVSRSGYYNYLSTEDVQFKIERNRTEKIFRKFLRHTASAATIKGARSIYMRLAAYVEIPKIGVNLPIYHSTGDDSLDRGVGHLLGSSLPVGGETSHAVLTAHSGLAGQRLFSDLDKLECGDTFYVHTLG